MRPRCTFNSVQNTPSADSQSATKTVADRSSFRRDRRLASAARHSSGAKSIASGRAGSACRRAMPSETVGNVSRACVNKASSPSAFRNDSAHSPATSAAGNTCNVIVPAPPHSVSSAVNEYNISSAHSPTHSSRAPSVPAGGGAGSARNSSGFPSRATVISTPAAAARRKIWEPWAGTWPPCFSPHHQPSASTSTTSGGGPASWKAWPRASTSSRRTAAIATSEEVSDASSTSAPSAIVSTGNGENRSVCSSAMPRNSAASVLGSSATRSKARSVGKAAETFPLKWRTCGLIDAPGAPAPPPSGADSGAVPCPETSHASFPRRKTVHSRRFCLAQTPVIHEIAMSINPTHFQLCILSPPPAPSNPIPRPPVRKPGVSLRPPPVFRS